MLSEQDVAKLQLDQITKQQKELTKSTLLDQESKPKKEMQLDLSQYDSSNPLALLTELPVLKSIQNFEEKLAAQISQVGTKGGLVHGSLDAPFIDVFDAQLPQSGTLVVLEKIPFEYQSIYEMGCQLLDEMCIKLDVQMVKLLVASNLPRTGYTSNAFRNSYFYDDRANTVFIHSKRLSDPGELALIIAHFVAHLKGNEFTNDNDIKFLTGFFSAIRIVLLLSFKTVSYSYVLTFVQFIYLDRC